MDKESTYNRAARSPTGRRFCAFRYSTFITGHAVKERLSSLSSLVPYLCERQSFAMLWTSSIILFPDAIWDWLRSERSSAQSVAGTGAVRRDECR